MNKKNIAGIILAAGHASRMGHPKQLLPWSGTTILGQVIKQARNSVLSPLVLVLGHRAEFIIQYLDLKHVQVVINSGYMHGQSSSLRTGVMNLPSNIDAALFLLGDQPMISVHIIDSIVYAYKNNPVSLVIPVCKNKRGNPVLIDRTIFPRLMQLQGDTGARILFDEYANFLLELEFQDQSILIDIDTWEDYQKCIGSKQFN